MIFSTLGRYFFRRYAMTTFWFLAGIFSLVFIIDFSEVAGRLSDLPKYSLSAAFLMTVFRIPTILQETVPFVALFSGMAALISLNRRYELVVTRASGISVWQFLQPFVLGAFLFGVLTVLALNPLAALGTKSAEALEAELGGTPSSKSALSIPWLRQIHGSDDAIIGARSVQDEGRTLINVTVIHFDPLGAIVSRQDAATAKLEDGYWLLNGVTETRNGQLPRRLATAQLPTHLKPEFVQETLTKPDSIPFFDLGRQIEVARSFGFPTYGMETQFHSMLALPLLLVAMTLIAASVSLKFSRFNQSRPVILGGILSGFVLYVVTVLVKAFGSSGIVPPFVAAWLPVVVAMALGSTILLHEEGWLVAVTNRKHIRLLTAILLSGVAFKAFLPAAPAWGQETSIDSLQPSMPEDAKMLLSANELVYNQDAERVIVRGAVQINYGGYQMVAQQVEYSQKTGRIVATGEIELIEPGGNRVYAEKMDVTDTFSDGFIETMRVETNDLTKLAAVTGERRNGEEMILNNAVYTACTPCATNPNHRSLWHLKAQRIVQNGKTHTVRMENAKFELFGRPILYLPVLEIPDHTVKRKSGFLFPKFKYTQKLGAGVSIPYYWAISPHMDATMTVTGLTRQGFLLESEFRQRFENGDHVLRMAGISQMDRGSFTGDTVDAQETSRGMIASAAKFEINPRWTFGWDVLVQSDSNFAKTYELSSFDGTTYTNQAYLTGLGKRNYFDMRAFYFDIQDADPDSIAENKQAKAQVLDYSYTAPSPVLGGELTADVNMTNINRNREDELRLNLPGGDVYRYRGLDGTYHRLSAEAEWKRNFIVPGGLSLTPILAARGDAIGTSMSDPSNYTGNYYDDDAGTRGMLTAGLEARYPILLTTANSSHIIEPIAQIFARPDESDAGSLPNEDAQSFVFDATSLFDRDKFSGFDRIEGGTRANLGLRYTGALGNGYALRAIAGQSFHLGGLNSFATDDLVKAGANSGLETDRSDYVGMVGIDAPSGITASLSGRFDEEDFSMRRADASVGYQGILWQTALTYTSIQSQPLYGSASDQDEIQTAAAYKFRDYWSIFGSVTYDLNSSVITRNGIGLTYDDRDTIFSLVYKEERDTDQSIANDWSIGARISFRTLGDINVGDTDFDGLN